MKKINIIVISFIYLQIASTNCWQTTYSLSMDNIKAGNQGLLLYKQAADKYHLDGLAQGFLILQQRGFERMLQDPKAIERAEIFKRDASLDQEYNRRIKKAERIAQYDLEKAQEKVKLAAWLFAQREAAQRFNCIIHFPQEDRDTKIVDPGTLEITKEFLELNTDFELSEENITTLAGMCIFLLSQDYYFNK